MVLRVGVCGMSHDHLWSEMHHVMGNLDCLLVGGLDVNDRLKRRFLEESQGAPLFNSIEELFAQKLDMVLVYGSNEESSEYIEYALVRNVFVFTEKPLCATREQAHRILDLWNSSGVDLLVNYPDFWRPDFQIGLQLIREGAIGDVTSGSADFGHSGPENIGCSPEFCRWLNTSPKHGGGVWHDYGCYGLAVFVDLFGPLEGVEVFGQQILDGRHVVGIAHFANAMTILNTSWKLALPKRDLSIHGTLGRIDFTDNKTWLQTLDSERIELKATETDVLYRNGIEYFVQVIKAGKKTTGPCSLEVNVEVIDGLDFK